MITQFKHNIWIKYCIMKTYGFNNKPLLELDIKSISNNIPSVPKIIKGTIKRFKIAITIVLKNCKKIQQNKYN